MRTLALLCAICLAGCASDLHLRTAAATRAVPNPGGVNAGGAIEIRSASSSVAGVLVALGIFALVVQDESPTATQATYALDPARSVSEQDCTRPLQEAGGNLRCR
ncbi:MAG: hypothetical protein AB7O31_09570 [Burkholderiales bacterium]